MMIIYSKYSSECRRTIDQIKNESRPNAEMKYEIQDEEREIECGEGRQF